MTPPAPPTSPGAQEPAWVADPGIAWRILLTATLAAPPSSDELGAALEVLHRDQGWPVGAGLARGDDAATLRHRLGEAPGTDLAVGLADRTLVVAAHHSRVDGLGLLAVLSALTGSEVTSSARGVGDRAGSAGFAGTVVRRLAEVALSPPAGVTAPSSPRVDPGHDTYVEQVVAGSWRTADLVHAATRGVVAHGARVAPGASVRHVAVAVGASRGGAGPDPGPIADRSVLLRLRDVEACSRDDVAALLRTAPLQHAGAPAGGGRGVRAAATRRALRALAPRLGSTLLVSHLGEVRADGVEHVSFHPVTAGGTGLSLGAIGLRGSTTLTLRSRGHDWSEPDLAELLAEVVRGLDGD